jgi:hypothetical protein
MTRGGSLRVVDAPQGETSEADIFAVESELQGVQATEFEEVFCHISEADIETDTGLPLYGAIRIHFAFLFAQNEHPPMAISHLVVLYRLLDDHLADHDYEAVRCDDLPPNYQAVVVDVAEKYDLPVRGVEMFGFHRLAIGMLAGLWGYLLLVLAQVVALVWKQIHRQLEPTKTVFVPHINRFDSTRPVLEALDHAHEVVLPTATVTWLRERDEQYADVSKFDPTPLDYFATPLTMADSLWRGARLGVEVLLTRSFDRRLQSLLDEELGVKMPNTLWYLLGNLFAVHVPSLANAVIAERMLAKLGPKNLVVGSLGSRQQAILYPAISAGVRTYHVPHSATTGYELLPPSETVHFVPGNHIVEQISASKQTSSTGNLIPTGRPQLLQVANRDIEPREECSTDALRIVVATQRFPDSHRETFISDVLDAIEEAPVPVDVVVKIHPNESPAFYEDVTADRPYPIKVAETDLHGYLAGADLVVTINSNVGLEAMVLGTPVVCATQWSPLIRARPYATFGPVPVLRSIEDFAAFFAGLNGERITQLTRDEREFVEEHYLHDDAAEEIARIVREGRLRPTNHLQPDTTEDTTGAE